MLAACFAGDNATCAWLCSQRSSAGPDLLGAAYAVAASGAPGCEASGEHLQLSLPQIVKLVR